MNSDMLKQDILNKVKEYYKLYHANKQTQFIEGKTKINYAGRIFDEKEMENLVDSSLDFGLLLENILSSLKKILLIF